MLSCMLFSHASYRRVVRITFALGYAAMSCEANMQPGRSAMASWDERMSLIGSGRPVAERVLSTASRQMAMCEGCVARCRIVYGLCPSWRSAVTREVVLVRGSPRTSTRMGTLRPGVGSMRGVCSAIWLYGSLGMGGGALVC